MLLCLKNTAFLLNAGITYLDLLRCIFIFLKFELINFGNAPLRRRLNRCNIYEMFLYWLFYKILCNWIPSTKFQVVWSWAELFQISRICLFIRLRRLLTSFKTSFHFYCVVLDLTNDDVLRFFKIFFRFCIVRSCFLHAGELIFPWHLFSHNLSLPLNGIFVG